MAPATTAVVMPEVADCFAYAASLTGADRCPRTLKLAFNELKDDGAIIISRFLSQFPTLTSLDLGMDDNPLTISFATILQSSLRSFLQHLKCMRLLVTTYRTGFNGIGDAGAAALANSLSTNSTLKVLHLSGNSITFTGFEALSKALELNTTLVSIYLSGNSGNSNGAAALADSICKNKSLKALCMNGNNVRDTGALSIGNMLRSNRALTHLNLVC